MCVKTNPLLDIRPMLKKLRNFEKGVSNLNQTPRYMHLQRDCIPRVLTASHVAEEVLE